MAVIIKRPEEIEKIRAAGRVVYEALQAMKAAIVPGESTTADLEKAAIQVLSARGATSPFLGYAPHNHPPYPAWTCISVNEQVVHGIPGRRVLCEGDIVSCDCGAQLDGYFGDSAWTFAVGKISPETQQLLDVTREALLRGIAAAKPGNRVGDIGFAIQSYVRRYGYGIVKDMVGHGVGKALHEEPQIPNLGRPGSGPLLREGMTIAIEPMINLGTGNVQALEDEWTIVTEDRSLSAHFEHTIAITRHGARILTQAD